MEVGDETQAGAAGEGVVQMHCPTAGHQENVSNARLPDSL